MSISISICDALTHGRDEREFPYAVADGVRRQDISQSQSHTHTQGWWASSIWSPHAPRTRRHAVRCLCHPLTTWAIGPRQSPVCCVPLLTIRAAAEQPRGIRPTICGRVSRRPRHPRHPRPRPRRRPPTTGGRALHTRSAARQARRASRAR